jgi:hypothetical protein
MLWPAETFFAEKPSKSANQVSLRLFVVFLGRVTLQVSAQGSRLAL